jgi:predicted amidohydrolase YtcJ
VFASAPARAGDVVVLRGGAVYTLNKDAPWASAVVIDDGRIVYVGDDAGTEAFVTPEARVVALAGKMVLPGLHDSHIHPMSGGMRLLRCRLDGLQTKDEVYATVGSCASAHLNEPWLLGGGWSPQMLEFGVLTKEELDELVPDRPAFLTNQDGFMAWVNSRALGLAGIAGDDHPGVVSGEEAQAVRRVIPGPSQAQYREALREATAMANRFGITSVVEAKATGELLDAYRAAGEEGELTVRVVAAQLVDPKRGPEQVDEMIEWRDKFRGRRLRADSAKIAVDGDFNERSAALLEPYADAPTLSGDLLIEPTALNRIVQRLDAESFLIHMHVMGDRAVRVGLDAFEHAIAENGPKDRRHQLAHIGVANPSDLPRFASLGIAANVQPIWLNEDDPAIAGIRASLGNERMSALYPMAGIWSAGGRVIASSDWPSPSMNPFEGMQVAITHQPLDGSKPAFQPEGRVDLATILAAYTINGAWGAGADAINGSIEIGKAADLVVLERNLFEVDPLKLHQTRVMLTLLEGEIVYRDPGFAWTE